MRRRLKAPRFGNLTKDWTPAIMDGAEVITSAIGGTVHTMDLAPVGVDLVPVDVGPHRQRAQMGRTAQDQAHIIVAHLRDIFSNAGGDMRDLTSLRVHVRPMADPADWGPALMVIREALGNVAYAESIVFTDFLGPEEEVLQVEARGRLRRGA
jgi:enamine deaminase RidA (YjgF/YER057c/UK114 family)